jgi:hypothetical protein
MAYPNLRVCIDPFVLTEVRRAAAAEGTSVGQYVEAVLAVSVGTVDAAAVRNLMIMAPALLATLDEGEEGGLI